MGFFQAIVLGVVQGLTEFLPVSSDGHLALVYRAFHQSPSLSFEVFLHFATLVAMIVYFRSDIVTLSASLMPKGKGTGDRRVVWYIVLATAISAAIAVVMKRVVESANLSLIAIGIGFVVTALALLAAELIAQGVGRREPSELGWPRTVVIAVGQALATLPGVSRSALTISSGMVSGLTREAAARFSFLIGIPIIAAANVYELREMLSEGVGMPSLVVAAAGFIAAGVSGYLAIWLLLKLVRTRPLYVFAVYTAVVGIATILWGLAG